MEVSSWEKQLFLWAIIHGELLVITRGKVILFSICSAWHCPFIDDFPIKTSIYFGDFPWRTVSHNQRAMYYNDPPGCFPDNSYIQLYIWNFCGYTIMKLIIYICILYIYNYSITMEIPDNSYIIGMDIPSGNLLIMKLIISPSGSSLSKARWQLDALVASANFTQTQRKDVQRARIQKQKKHKDVEII